MRIKDYGRSWILQPPSANPRPSPIMYSSTSKTQPPRKIISDRTIAYRHSNLPDFSTKNKGKAIVLWPRFVSDKVSWKIGLCRMGYCRSQILQLCWTKWPMGRLSEKSHRSWHKISCRKTVPFSVTTPRKQACFRILTKVKPQDIRRKLLFQSPNKRNQSI